MAIWDSLLRAPGTWQSLLCLLCPRSTENCFFFVPLVSGTHLLGVCFACGVQEVGILGVHGWTLFQRALGIRLFHTRGVRQIGLVWEMTSSSVRYSAHMLGSTAEHAHVSAYGALLNFTPCLCEGNSVLCCLRSIGNVSSLGDYFWKMSSYSRL